MSSWRVFFYEFRAVYLRALSYIPLTFFLAYLEEKELLFLVKISKKEFFGEGKKKRWLKPECRFQVFFKRPKNHEDIFVYSCVITEANS